MVSDEVLIDDQSHYEVSLTAGQAFVAFVLLLLSLAASFAFGLMIGKGQADERLVVRKEPAVINEGSVIASKKNDGKLVDLGVGNDDFKAPAPATTSSAPADRARADDHRRHDHAADGIGCRAGHGDRVLRSSRLRSPRRNRSPRRASTGPAYAQLLVTSDQKTADALAAKAIDHGFMTTYVERAGTSFKVRVKFNSEAEARANEAKLKEISKDVWFVK